MPNPRQPTRRATRAGALIALLHCLVAPTSSAHPDAPLQHQQLETRPGPSEPQPRTLAANPRLPLSNPHHHEVFRYLVSCALPAGVELRYEATDKPIVFKGSMGLAPKWAERPLTPSEERWVSACMLARTNAFGRRTQISLRAAAPPTPTLEASAAEAQTYTLFEGAFWGNLFTEPPEAYACAAYHPRNQPRNTALEHRVCAEPSGARAPDGAALTHCGFIYTGFCADLDGLPSPPAQQIRTYLQPSGDTPLRPATDSSPPH